MEVFTGFPGQSADSVSHRGRKMGASRGRSEKNAIRVCGDWSEQLSSKGKIYFYNCITEVSQWQKPAEWKLPDMEPEELLRRLANRGGQIDGKHLKRPRSGALPNYCHLKRDSENRRASPKRTKLNVDRTECNDLTACKFSIRSDLSLRSDRQDSTSACNNGDFGPSPSCAPRDPTKCSSEGSSKRPTSTTSSRPFPTDDMEISPNSSPLSNSSSPSNTNLSPCFSRCTRVDYHSDRLQHSSHSASHEVSETSGTLRQLVDAIRASIGGLLDCPATADEPTGADSVSRNSHHFRNPSRLEYASDIGHDVHHISPSHLEYGHRRSVQLASTDYHSTESLIPTDSDQCNHINDDLFSVSSNPVQDNRTTNVKAIPGLVSTLTTLVNLIGHSKCPDILTRSSPVASTVTDLSEASRKSVLPPSDHILFPPTQSPRTPTVQKTYGCNIEGAFSYANSYSSLTPTSGTRQPEMHRSDFDSSYTDVEANTVKPSIDYYEPYKTPFRSGASDRIMPRDCSFPRSHSPNQVSDSASFRRDTTSNALSFHHRNPGDSSDVSFIRHCPESLDGFDRLSSDASVRVRLRYACSKHINGLCKSPCLERNDFQSPVPKESFTENGVIGESSSKLFPCETNTFPADDTPSLSSKTKDEQSPDGVPEDESAKAVTQILSSSSTQAFVDSSMVSKFMDKAVDRLEEEVHQEADKFEKLQSVLYGELSAESKKLRALVRISEAKLAIHREKQTSLQELMDAIETRKHLPNLSFSDDAL